LEADKMSERANMRKAKRSLPLWFCVLGLLLARTASFAQVLPPPPPNWWTNFIPSGWTNTVWWTNQPPPFPTNQNSGWQTNYQSYWTNVPPLSTNTAPAWTNILHGGDHDHDGQWTNTASYTNLPPSWSPTNFHPRAVATGQTGPPTTTTDVRKLVAQFQQQRAQLENTLNNASDNQRQVILGQLETLRQQLITQLQQFRQMAVDQAHAMQGFFNNGSHFAPGNVTPNPPPQGPGGGKPR
jgi:hypothetical protein